MKERGILMTATNVRSIIAGTKTQTRRRVAFPRKRDSFVLQDDGNGWWPYQSDDGESSVCNDGCEHPYACPYGVPGDRLWVRETWRTHSTKHDQIRPRDLSPHGDVVIHYDASMQFVAPFLGKGRPSIFMPRWASRITLEITDVRVERLQEISEADAVAEGVTVTVRENGALDPFRELWRSINGPGSWDANPYVWVIEFRRLP